jgi:hypothetical protein
MPSKKPARSRRQAEQTCFRIYCLLLAGFLLDLLSNPEDGGDPEMSFDAYWIARRYIPEDSS